VLCVLASGESWAGLGGRGNSARRVRDVSDRTLRRDNCLGVMYFSNTRVERDGLSEVC